MIDQDFEFWSAISRLLDAWSHKTHRLCDTLTIRDNQKVASGGFLAATSDAEIRILDFCVPQTEWL